MHALQMSTARGPVATPEHSMRVHLAVLAFQRYVTDEREHFDRLAIGARTR